MATSLWEHRRRREGKGVETIIVVEGAEKGRARDDECETVWTVGWDRTRNRCMCCEWASDCVYVCVRVPVSWHKQVSCIGALGLSLSWLHKWNCYICTGCTRKKTKQSTHTHKNTYCAEEKSCQACTPTWIGFFCFEWEAQSESTGISNTI